MHDHAIADHAALADADILINQAVPTEDRAPADHGIGINFRAVADDRSGHDDRAGVDADPAGVQVCGGIDDRRGMNARFERVFESGKMVDHRGKSQSGIRRFDQCHALRRIGHARRHETGSSRALEKLTMVFGPGPEAQRVRQIIITFLKGPEGVQLKVVRAPQGHLERILSDWLEMVI